MYSKSVACKLELQRSLSNTEDECTHLKEMNERTQEELRELANKYNGAVNEIKDLSDKLKVCVYSTRQYVRLIVLNRLNSLRVHILPDRC